MDLVDLGGPLPGQGTGLVKTTTGDIASTTGIDSLTSWIVHCAATSRGRLYHRPGYGGGLPSRLGQSVALLAATAADLRASILRDRRVKTCTVETRQSITQPGRTDFICNVTTTSGDAMAVTLPV